MRDRSLKFFAKDITPWSLTRASIAINPTHTFGWQILLYLLRWTWCNTYFGVYWLQLYMGQQPLSFCDRNCTCKSQPPTNTETYYLSADHRKIFLSFCVTSFFTGRGIRNVYQKILQCPLMCAHTCLLFVLTSSLLYKIYQTSFLILKGHKEWKWLNDLGRALKTFLV